MKLAGITAAFAIFYWALVAQSFAQSALAQMAGPDGTQMGSVLLRHTPNGILIEVKLSGLSEGGHGFHIHERGACDPDFSVAGDHFNPSDNGHGLGKSGRHAGDLPNVFANRDGTVRADIITAAFSLDDGPKTLIDDDRSAIIVHEKPDSYRKSAGAGGIVACGVINLQDLPDLASQRELNFWVTASDFVCLRSMVQVRQFYVGNILGDLTETLRVANSPSGGIYPPGSVVQLVPTEVMVKHRPGWDAETNDWEFFYLDVDLGTTFIVNRGHEDVMNRSGGNCFECHQKARPEWDFICERDHGCDPVKLTRKMIAEIQQNDPRCE